MTKKKEKKVTENILKERLDKSEKIIKTHVNFSMIAGAIPIPLVDIASVTAIQMDMLNQLSNVYEIDFNTQKGKSIVSSLISSTIGATLGRMGASVVKVIPIFGTALGVSSQVILSGATTYATGKVFQNHFQNNGILEDFKIKDYQESFKEFFNSGKKEAKKQEKNLSNKDIIETISKLKGLKDKGVITEEEFNNTKTELLNKLKNN